jgi:hypothetical protein
LAHAIWQARHAAILKMLSALFADGRKVRFQAKRKYDPFSGDWKFDQVVADQNNRRERLCSKLLTPVYMLGSAST